MTDKPTHHIDEDGAIYAAEIVPPERNKHGAKYHVDLVRPSVDDYGLGQAAPHRRSAQLVDGGRGTAHEVEDALKRTGSPVGARTPTDCVSSPLSVFYMTAVYPPDAPEGRDSAAQLLAVSESEIARATLAVGPRESVERVIDRIDLLGLTKARPVGW